MKVSVFKIHSKIWYLNLQNSLSARMAYPYNFFIMILGVAVQMGLNIVFINIIYSYVNKISGWDYYEALLVVASYMFIEGLMWGTCAYMGMIQKTVRNGALDSILVKPKDAQYLLTIGRGDPEDWVRVITALLVLYKVIKGLGMDAFNLLINFPFYIILVISAFFIIYSITLIVRSVAFWVIDSSAIWLVTEGITTSSKYPTDIFKNKFLKIIFATIIPLTFMATVPAKILIDGPKFSLIIASIFIAFVFFIASRKFFHFALKNYESASS